MVPRPAGLALTVAVLLVAGAGCSSTAAPPPPAPPPASSAAPATLSPAESKASAGLFTTPVPWTKDVRAEPKSERSDAILAALDKAGGWGNGNKLQTDFGIPIFITDTNTPRKPVSGIEDYCYGGPDCDAVPAQIPLPDDAYIETSTDLKCDISVNDCHLLVVDKDERKLYEIYQGNQDGDQLTAQGVFIWDLDKSYPETLRGAQCTSADAAGFPIAALMPTADEVAAGQVDHAIRFILPNDRMKEGVYVAPATHAGGPRNSDPDAPPYGVRLRLKADFDDSKFTTQQKVIITAIKTYGMLLADGGEIALTFADDKTTTAKWAELGIEPQTFNDISPDQFEVVDLGPEIDLTYDCVRNP